MQHFHFTFKRRRFDELKGIVEICVNSDQSGFIDSGSSRLRNSGKVRSDKCNVVGKWEGWSLARVMAVMPPALLVIVGKD